MSEKNYKILNRKDLSGSELELEVEIPSEVLEGQRQKAIETFSKELEFPGFRKGTAPEKLVLEKVGEMAIMEEIAHRAINNILPELIVAENIDALTQPKVSVTKIAPKTPLVFKITLTLMPEIELPDYKNIAKNTPTEKEEKVSEKEVQEYIDQIRTQRAQAIKSAQNENSKDDNKKDLDLPELNDEFVKSLGKFENVADFKKQLEDNMNAEKKTRAMQKRRLEIIEKIIEKSKVEVPEILITQEQDRMFGQFTHDIERMKMSVDEYLKEIKKTEEDLRKEWKTDAEKRVKMNLILPKIASEEKIKISDEDIEKEVGHLKSHHPDIDEMNAKIYVASVLTNEEVFKFLEEIK